MGSDLIRKETSLGFATMTDEAKTGEEQYQKMREKVLTAMKSVFRPEFLNRVDATVVFHALSRDHIRQIVELEMNEVERHLTSKGLVLEMTDTAKDWIGSKGFDPVFGARPLRRIIQNEIEDRLSEALLEGRFNEGDTVRVDVQNDEIILINVSEPALA